MIATTHAPAHAWYDQLYHILYPTLKDKHECKAITQCLLAYYLDYDLTKHVLEKTLVADKVALQALNNAIKRLQNDEPIQYILGEAPFLSYTFFVNPNVLIPRPETAEMVQTILDENNLTHKAILDIGTGSGCIAITLKKENPSAHLTAIDISKEALRVAQANAHALNLDIQWHQLDFLHQALPQQKWDIIVSNPPYVPTKEKDSMAKHVVAYEPHTALFVPNTNPLLFYERIATIAPQYLHKKGKVYVEFHEKTASHLTTLFQKNGFEKVTIYKDLQGKSRYLVATYSDKIHTL